MSEVSTRRAFSGVSVGETLPSKTVHIDRARLVQYAGASLDRNPIHWDERFAVKVGLPNVIAHGMFTMGAAVTIVTEWAGDAGAVVRYGTRFTKPVVVPYDAGADIEVSASVTSLDEANRQVTVDVAAVCAGDRVLGRAQAVVQLA
jgi:acyl dehydratase